MRRLAILFLMSLASLGQAEADPLSVRCDGPTYSTRGPEPYFMTFDVETRHFVFERPGGNVLAGEIISANDDRLELSLTGAGGRILLSFKRKPSVLIWPGLPAGELGRHLLQHDCKGMTARTALSYFYQPEQFDPNRRDPVDAFSLSCPGKTGGLYFVTMDRVTKTVVVETEHFSGKLSGHITGSQDSIIEFSFGRGRTDEFDARWDERSLSLTFPAVANDPSRPGEVQQCVVTKPRSILDGINWARLAK
jgi:hypothetical protein